MSQTILDKSLMFKDKQNLTFHFFSSQVKKFVLQSNSLIFDVKKGMRAISLTKFRNVEQSDHIYLHLEK